MSAKPMENLSKHGAAFFIAAGLVLSGCPVKQPPTNTAKSAQPTATPTASSPSPTATSPVKPGATPTSCPTDRPTVLYEPGCHGEPRIRCERSDSLPTMTQWCGCDGNTITSHSHLPPLRTRYRYPGPCNVKVSYRLQKMSSSPGGRTLLYLRVVDAEQRLADWPEDCNCTRMTSCGKSKLFCLRCEPSTGPEIFVVSRSGKHVVAHQSVPAPTGAASPEKEVARFAVPTDAKLHVSQ